MGSSIVTMWPSRVLLMWSIIAASVVVLPEPAVPVTRTRPRGSSASRWMIRGGRAPRSDGLSVATRRMVMPTLPRWWKTLTRKRPTPAAE